MSVTVVRQTVHTFASGSSFPVTLSATAAVGNTLVLVYGSHASGGFNAGIQSVSDNAGNTWHAAAGYSPDYPDLEIRYCTVAAPTSTVTVTYPSGFGSIDGCVIRIFELSQTGGDTLSVDVISSDSQTNTAPATGSTGAPADSSGIAIAAIVASQGSASFSGQTAGWTVDGDDTGGSVTFDVAHLNPCGASALAYAATLGASTEWVAVVAVFKEVPPPPPLSIVNVTDYSVTTPPNVGGTTTVMVTLVAPATVGNQLYVLVGIRGPSFPFVNRVIDDGGNSWLNPIWWDGTNVAVELWDVDVATSCTTVSVTMLGGALNAVDIRIYEVSGASSAASTTNANDVNSSGGSPDSLPVNPGAGEFVVAAIAWSDDGGTMSGQTAGYTVRSPDLVAGSGATGVVLDTAVKFSSAATERYQGTLSATPSEWAALIATFPVPGPPGVPTNVVGLPGDTQVILSWDTPNSFSTITSYTIQPYIGTTPQTPITVGNYNSYIVTGLTNGTTYGFTVTATSSYGSGPTSTEIFSTPVANPITIVRETHASFGWTGSQVFSLPVMLSAPSQAGNSLVVEISAHGIGVSVAQVSDDGGNPWAQLVASSGGWVEAAIWGSNQINPTTTVTIGFAVASDGGVSIRILELSNCDAQTVLARGYNSGLDTAPFVGEAGAPLPSGNVITLAAFAIQDKTTIVSAQTGLVPQTPDVASP